jgi:heme-degrading monooxygenase HmoA
MAAEPTLFAVGEWTVKPGKEESFLESWEEFARWTMENVEGTGEVWMLRGAEQQNRFISFGSWQNQEAMMAWRRHPKFREAFLRFRELCNEITPGTMKSVIHF